MLEKRQAPEDGILEKRHALEIEMLEKRRAMENEIWLYRYRHHIEIETFVSFLNKKY